MSQDQSLRCEVVSTRVFKAPRERVFEAFSDPGQLARWWGPRGFTNEFHEFDLRPGGRWRFTMRGPDGAVYRIAKDFIEVVRPERVVYENLDPSHRFRMTMTFAERQGGTELTWRMRFELPAEFARVKDLVAAANEENFDRLAAHLAATSGD